MHAKLPDFNIFTLSNDRFELVDVGKWYCPFMFVKERLMKLKDQMKNTVFYELTSLPKIIQRFTKNPRGITLLHRIGIGLIIHIVIMVIASLTERYRLRVAKGKRDREGDKKRKKERERERESDKFDI